MKIAILILTHNAPRYVFKTIKSFTKFTAKSYYRKLDIETELIIVDNKSKFLTRFLLKTLYKKGIIDKLYLNNKNDLFAKGNNIAASLSSSEVTHYLLLNSDIEIKSQDWLEKLTTIYPANEGISSFGAVLTDPIRADGYCMLISKKLYDKYQLDEHYQWWWSVTKLESEILKDGFKINAVNNHEEYLHHFGGKSGKGYKDAKNMNIPLNEVINWFKNTNSVNIIDKI